MEIFTLILLVLLLFPSAWKWKGFHEKPLSKEQTNSLRGIFAVCIMGGHISLYWSAHSFGFSPLNAFWMTAGTWSTAVFFFLSGFGLVQQKNARPDYLHGFLQKRMTKILVPFLSILTIYYFVSGNFTPVWEIFRDYSQKNPLNSNSWFIWAILYFYFLFWLTGRWIKARSVSFLLLLCGTGLYVESLDLIFHFAGWWFYTCVLFPLGVAWGNWENSLEPLVKKVYWLILPATWLGFGMFYLKILPSFHLPETLIMGCTAICWVLGVLLLGMKFQPRGKIWDFTGKISLEIYLIHGLWLTLCNQPFFWTHPWTFPVTVCGLSILSAAILHKIFRALNS